MEPFNQQLSPALVAKARLLEQLTAALNKELPPETDGHYHVASLDNSTLVVITDSPVWTARLRQLAPVIIKTLNELANKNFKHVRIISRHGSIEAPKQKKNLINRMLSEETGQHLKQTAEHIKDKELKEALLRFSKKAQKTRKPE